MEIWTAKEINEWERKRREVSFQIIDFSKSFLLFSISSPRKVENATIMLLVPRNLEGVRWSVETDGEEINYDLVEAYGFSFLRFTRSIEKCISVKAYFGR